MTIGSFLFFLLLTAVYIFLVILFRRKRYKRHEKEKKYLDSETIQTREKYLWDEKIFIWIGSILVIPFLLLLSCKIFRMIEIGIPPIPKNPAPPLLPAAENWFDLVLTHFDVAGIIIGIIGIVVGFFIFIVVENNHEKKDAEINAQLKTLKEATDNIGLLNEQIKENLVSLSRHKDMFSMHEGIQKLVNDAQHYNNDLYILSYAPIYGQYLMSNLAVILRENGTPVNKLETITHKEFFENYLKHSLVLKDKIKGAIHNYVSRQGNLKIAVLKNDWVDQSLPAKFTHFIQNQINKGNCHIVPIEAELDEKITGFGPGIEHTYVYKADKKSSDPHREIVATLNKNNEVFIKDLIRNENVSFDSLDYIPFQFFLSIPKNADHSSRYESLLIFTNYKNLGQENGVVSFVSGNKELAEGLKKMYQGLVADQISRDKSRHSFHELLKTHNGAEIKIVLKSIDIKPHKRKFTPVTDSLTKDKLLVMLDENDIEFDFEINFLEEESLNETLGMIYNGKASFFAIGLFENALSEFLGASHKQHNVPGISGKFFKISKDGGTKKVKVAVESSYEEFVDAGKLNDGNPETNEDYAVFCKQHIGASWTFIFGGLNYWGTRNINACFTKDNCNKIHEHAGSDKEFVAVFNVKGKEASLVFLSVQDEHIRRVI